MFLYVQTVRHTAYFIAEVVEAEGEEPPEPHAAILSGPALTATFVLLVVALTAIVLLAKSFSVTMDKVVLTLGAPHAVVGLLVAMLVLLPESVAAIAAARRDRLQSAINLALGSSLATIGLTIPAVGLLSIILDKKIALGLGPSETVLLLLTLAVSMLTFGGGRTNILPGFVHLTLMAVFGFLIDHRPLEAGFAHDFDRLAPVDIGQADVHQRHVDLIGLDGGDGGGAGRRLDDGEFLVQTQLFGQRVAQRVIVVDDQDFAGRAHRLVLIGRTWEVCKDVRACEGDVTHDHGKTPMTQRYICVIRVHRLAPRGPRALLVAGSLRLPCRIGGSGATHDKREGDGRSPLKPMRVLAAFWRADRRLPPRTGVRLRPIRAEDGWCDAPGHRAYNRPVRLPLKASHEAMRRDDGQYDVVLDLDWNRTRRAQGRGSAIFLHLMSDARGGTAGCVAVPTARIDALMALIGPRTLVRIV